jgi:hypothetical protein
MIHAFRYSTVEGGREEERADEVGFGLAESAGEGWKRGLEDTALILG